MRPELRRSLVHEHDTFLGYRMLSILTADINSAAEQIPVMAHLVRCYQSDYTNHELPCTTVMAAKPSTARKEAYGW